MHDHPWSRSRHRHNRLWRHPYDQFQDQLRRLRRHHHKTRYRYAQRLSVIYDDLGQIIRQYHPDEVAVEKLYFGKNITTGISVGQARGVLLLRLAQENLPIGEYTPMQVKQALVGFGHAEKKQIQYMVQNFLKLPELPKPDDAGRCAGHRHLSCAQSQRIVIMEEIMIGYLKGTVAASDGQIVTLMVGGVGFEVMMPNDGETLFTIGEEAAIYTSHARARK